MTNELIVIPQAENPYAIMPVLDIQAAAVRRQAVVDFTKLMMVAGTDFGKIPGTGDKPTLLKPGAEKLASLFGLSPHFEVMERQMDWTGSDHDGEPFFFFQYRCTLSRGAIVAGQGVGSCNSWEKKYRYRKGERVCPNCGAAAIIKGKEQYGGGWLCFGKKGGCGSKFNDGDPAIENQGAGQVKNPDPADVVNTIDKMAQKRALVAAVLIAVNASELFTQDIEDYSDIVDADWTHAPAQTKTHSAAKAARKSPPPPSDEDVTIREASARDFVNVAASLLSTDTDDLKERLKNLGYTGIPGKPDERVKAYHALKDAAATAQDDLFGDEPQPVGNGAYSE